MPVYGFNGESPLANFVRSPPGLRQPVPLVKLLENCTPRATQKPPEHESPALAGLSMHPGRSAVAEQVEVSPLELDSCHVAFRHGDVLDFVERVPELEHPVRRIEIA